MLDGDNAVVDVTPKALEILCVLVKNRGRVVSKEELLRIVWVGSFVEEANLSHHIFRLRRALSESEDYKFIETVPKRGYRFVFENGIERVLGASASIDAPVVIGEKARTINKLALVIASVVIAVAAIGSLIFLLPKRSAVTAEERSQAPRSDTRRPISISRVTNTGPVGGSTISPDGKFIAFIQNSSDGDGMLYVRQTETSAELKLLPPGEGRTFGGTAFSPDSNFIYYVLYDKAEPNGALYRIPVLGGVPARLIQNFHSMFTISPDGGQVCFLRRDEERREQSLMIAALDGTGERALLVRPYSEFNFCGSPAWSPDGQRIAYGVYTERVPDSVYEAKLFSVEINGGEIKQLTDEVWSEIGKMNWLADGSGVVFAGTRPRSGIQIYCLTYPAGELHRITNELNSYGNYGMGVTSDGTTLVADVWESSAQIWSVGARGQTQGATQLTAGNSDGASGIATMLDGEIVYSSRAGFDDDLWAMHDEAGKRVGRPLTNDEYFEGEVAASPDSRSLVFISDRAGSPHVFRSDADGSNLKQLTFGEAIDSRPDISPDGNWVIYSSWLNAQSRIWKVAIDGGTPLRLTDFDSLAPTFSPDGRSIACITPVRSPASPASVEIISSEGGPPIKSFDVLPFDFAYRPVRWTPSGDALIFRRTDKNVGNLWKQRLSGGDPQPLTDFKSDIIFGFAFSRDGKSIVVSRGKRTVNVVMIRNFS